MSHGHEREVVSGGATSPLAARVRAGGGALLVEKGVATETAI